MNPSDDIPMTEAEQPVTASSLREIQEIPSGARESQSVSLPPVRESRENPSAVRESQSVTPSPASEGLENPSAVIERQAVTPSPVRESQANPSAVRESRSVTPSPVRESRENPSTVRESQSMTPSPAREGLEIPSAVIESQAVTPSPVRERQENPSAARESRSVPPSPVRDTQENPSAVRESQSVNLSHVRETRENPLGLRESQSVTPSPVRETLENRSAVSSIRSEGGELSNANPSALNQIVLYDPDSANNRRGRNENHTRAAPSFSTPLSSGELFGSFTVQCNNCFKWRLIPTKDKYEKIRENISQKPFVCDQAREWNRVLSCEDPTDISQDDTRLWAIDKPNIAQPPQGWERLIRLRGEGGTRFADVYYVTPSGKKLRSMVEVERYLTEHSIQGVHISQFSFQTPKPLRADYVRKRPRRTFGGLELSRPLEPTEVTPISWAPPLAVSHEEHTSSPRSSSATESI